ncbi:MAG: alpha/beta hydrolase [Chloroflexi bacterium]|nr:alpha/beta hydrolase [Chloroflexota bacterium]MCC6892860.1 alpha/beta hydrolase [Anaerolineae bacterium]
MNAQAELALENKLRAALRFPRLFVAYAPFNLLRRLQHLALYRVKLLDEVTTTLSAQPRGEWFTSPEADAQSPVILYIHGGGFVLPQTHLHRLMVAHITKRVKGRAFMLDYRLAPEYPFPAGLDDCIEAYTYLLDQGIAPEQITVMGDSAGGNLTLGLLLTLRDRGLPLPSQGITMSAPTDFADDNPGWAVRDGLLHPRAADRFSASYVGSADVRNPLISPLYADLHGLPPLLMYAGKDEALCSDSERFAEAAEAAGVDVTLKVYPRMWHVWQLMMELPQARQSIDEMVEAICTRGAGREAVLKPDALFFKR